MINTAIIGYGYWGINLVRNTVNHPAFNVKYVCDKRPERLALLSSAYPSIKTTTDVQTIFTDSDIDCVIIATNPSSHFELADFALMHGKHVLVEKPFTTNVENAIQLIEKAEKSDLILMVDHTFLYHGAVKKIKEIIDAGELGTIHYIDSTRINLGIFQNDINVLCDLATHDLSIINYITGELPISVAATGKCHIKTGIENIAYLTLLYNSNLIVHIHSSWSSPVKMRQMLIGGDKKMLVYNDIEPSEKIKVYDSQIMLSDEHKEKILVDYRVGDVFVPKHDTTEALTSMVADLADAILAKKQPLSDANKALQIMKILEAAQQSLRNNSSEITPSF